MFEMPPANETPDVFVLLELRGNYHILSGYYSSYLGEDSWRLSTRLKRVEPAESEEPIWLVETESGSKYTLNLRNIGVSSTSGAIKTQLLKEENCKIIEKDTEIDNIFEKLLAAE